MNSEKKVIAYKIFPAYTDDDAKRLMGKMGEGWQPWGSPVFKSTPSADGLVQPSIYQAFVKYAD